MNKLILLVSIFIFNVFCFAASQQKTLSITLPDAAHGKVPTKNIEEKKVNIALVKIEAPTTANRGENLFIGVYPPTDANIEEVIMLLGVANYLVLNKQPDTSFTGYFRVPDIFEPGQYSLAFFFRTKDNKRFVLQRLLTVQ